MADLNDTPGETGGLRAVVDNIGSNPSYSQPLSEELQPYARQVLDMDPFEDVSGASTVTPGKVAVTPSIDALPPDLQGRVRAELRDVPPELAKEREGAVVLRVLKERVYNNRAETGIGEDSLPFHKVDVELAGRIRQLDREIAQYEGYLSDVRDHETVMDPETGEKKAQPILRVTGPRRRGFEATLNDLKRQRRLLIDDDGNLGVEAVREKRKALAESAQILKNRAEAAEDAAEVARRVAAQAREKRIERQVRAKLNLIDPDHGK